MNVRIFQVCLLPSSYQFVERQQRYRTVQTAWYYDGLASMNVRIFQVSLLALITYFKSDLTYLEFNTCTVRDERNNSNITTFNFYCVNIWYYFVYESFYVIKVYHLSPMCRENKQINLYHLKL